MNEPKYVFVLAGSYQQYTQCLTTGRRVKVGDSVTKKNMRPIYARDADSVLGMVEPFRYVTVGTFYDRSDCHEILDIIRICGGIRLQQEDVEAHG